MSLVNKILISKCILSISVIGQKGGVSKDNFTLCDLVVKGGGAGIPWSPPNEAPVV